MQQASTTPDQTQPWAELGLKQDEYTRIREILGRRPSSSELNSIIAALKAAWDSSANGARSPASASQPSSSRRRSPDTSAARSSA